MVEVSSQVVAQRERVKCMRNRGRDISKQGAFVRVENERAA